MLNKRDCFMALWRVSAQCLIREHANVSFPLNFFHHVED